MKTGFCLTLLSLALATSVWADGINYNGTKLPTDLEPTPNPSLKGWEKYLRNGMLFIKKDGKTYTITGQKIK